MHSIKCHIKEVGLYLTLMGLSHTTWAKAQSCKFVAQGNIFCQMYSKYYKCLRCTNGFDFVLIIVSLTCSHLRVMFSSTYQRGERNCSFLCRVWSCCCFRPNQILNWSNGTSYNEPSRCGFLSPPQPLISLALYDTFAIKFGKPKIVASAPDNFIQHTNNRTWVSHTPALPLTYCCRQWPALTGVFLKQYQGWVKRAFQSHWSH